MKIVAGLFNSQSEATQAMDILLRSNIPDLETKVYETGSPTNSTEAGSSMVIPVIPTTGATGLGQPGAPAAAAVGAAGIDRDWLDELDDRERAFYHEGYREGATLAMAKVNDDHVGHVRELFRQHGARTFTKD